jgi:hypothetical protein
MLEMIFFIWLLGTTIFFVSVAMMREAREPSEALWLLTLAAIWPVILLLMLIGVILVAFSALLQAK